MSVCPAGSRIVEVRFTRQDRLPAPVRVRVSTPDGAERQLILRMDSHIGGVETEAAILPALARLGLPVPSLLAGPCHDPEHPSLGPLTVLSFLPGEDLLTWAWDASAPDLNTAIQLVLASVERLHALTEALARERVAERLTHRSLQEELDGVIERGGPWFGEPLFVGADERLRPGVAEVRTPLAFSSGDYNLGIFLWNGERVTGFSDFAAARFEDPHNGMATYLTYDWYPLNKAGIVERYVASRRLTAAELAPGSEYVVCGPCNGRSPSPTPPARPTTDGIATVWSATCGMRSTLWTCVVRVDRWTIRSQPLQRASSC